MAAEIERKFGAKCELVPGSKGVFDVSLDGRLLFSKQEEGRFPGAPEILEQIEEVR